MEFVISGWRGRRAELQKATDYLAGRQTSANKFIDDMLKLSHSAENRARMEKMKSRTTDYSARTQSIVTVRKQAIGLSENGAVASQLSPELSAKVNSLNDEANRIAREVTLPIADEIEDLANKVVDFAKQRADAEIVSSATCATGCG